MADENWQQVKKVLEDALRQEPEDRRNFVLQACAADKALLAEVESLLASLERTDDFLEMPAVVQVADLIAAESGKIGRGKRLGHYELLKKIGTGGMGEVFLARDKKLDRLVAVKILVEKFSGHESNLKRFIQEAKAASALNHPNILTIYDFGASGEAHYIVSEYIEGKTLREILKRSTLKLPEILDITIQIAGALAAAHRANLVHRDIKPENIMVRPDGFVKVLDFGLAKLVEQKNKSVLGLEESTGLGQNQTAEGVILGTVNYMSPEQARAKEVDERTDIWSLGVVLYEMLTGETPFAGETTSDTISAILSQEAPPLSRNLPGISNDLEEIALKTLRKNREERYRNIDDLLIDLRGFKQVLEFGGNFESFGAFGKAANITAAKLTAPTGEGEPPATFSAEYITTRIKRHWFGAATVALFLVLIVAALGFYSLKGGQPVPSFSSIQASSLTDTGRAQLADISPDGKFVAFVNDQDGKRNLLVRELATGSSITLVPPSPSVFYPPAIAPAGDFIYYTMVDRGIGTLFQVPTGGGESRKIVTDVDSKITFSPDGKRFAFLRHDPDEGGDSIFIADRDGRNIEEFIKSKTIDRDSFALVDWSPDGEKMLVLSPVAGSETKQKVQIIAIGMSDRKIEPVGDKIWFGVRGLEWIKSGDGIVVVGKEKADEHSQIWHLSYPHGETRQITNDTSEYTAASVSDDGLSMVTTRVDALSSFWTLNPQTREMKQLTAENKNLYGYSGISQTSDGKILYVKKSGQGINIFSMNEDGTGEKQLTSGESINLYPAATADGKYIVFVSDRAGSFTIWRMNADGSGVVRLTESQNTTDSQPQITADGKTVVFMRYPNDAGKTRLLRVSIDGGEAAPIMPETARSEYFPGLSPDGKKIVYQTFTSEPDNPVKDPKVIVAGFDGERIDHSNAKEITSMNFPAMKFSPDGKSLTYIKESGINNLWNYSLENQKETPLTDFTSGSLPAFLWSHDGRKLFIVKAVYHSDLVLIKDKRKN